MKFKCYGCKRLHDDFNWKTLYINSHLRHVCSLFFISSIHEFIPDRVLMDRTENFNSVVQPFRGEQLSREYIEAHGTKGINVSKEEVKKSKYVWKDLKGWNNRRKSK